MENPDDISCQTCKWFRLWSKDERYSTCNSGNCMYNPPVFDPNYAGRPFTRSEDYCSRYEKKNEEKETEDA